MSHSSFNSAETSLYAYAAARVDGSNRISPRNGLWTRGACVGVLIVAMFVNGDHVCIGRGRRSYSYFLALAKNDDSIC